MDPVQLKLFKECITLYEREQQQQQLMQSFQLIPD